MLPSGTPAACAMSASVVASTPCWCTIWQAAATSRARLPVGAESVVALARSELVILLRSIDLCVHAE